MHPVDGLKLCLSIVRKKLNILLSETASTVIKLIMSHEETTKGQNNFY